MNKVRKYLTKCFTVNLLVLFLLLKAGLAHEHIVLNRYGSFTLEQAVGTSAVFLACLLDPGH